MFVRNTVSPTLRLVEADDFARNAVGTMEIQTIKSAVTQKQNRARCVVLDVGKARPVDKEVFALPWSWGARIE